MLKLKKNVEFDLAPHSHSPNTDKLKFNKDDWYTLTQFLYKLEKYV